MEVSNKELAKALGVPASRVSEWLKRGMPRSPELAKAWRFSNAAPRKRPQAQAGLQIPPSLPPPAAGQSWEDRLQRARDAEIAIYQTLQQALRGMDTKTLANLQSSHLLAIKEIAEAEKIASRAQVESGELIHREIIRAIWREVIPPLKAAIERLPVQTRATCNPEHPEVAEAALKAEVRNLLARISQAESKF